MDELSGDERLRSKLAGMRPAETKMIAASYRVKKDKKNPSLFKLKAPNQNWSKLMSIDEMIRYLKEEQFLNLDILWE